MEKVSCPIIVGVLHEMTPDGAFFVEVFAPDAADLADAAGLDGPRDPGVPEAAARAVAAIMAADPVVAARAALMYALADDLPQAELILQRASLAVASVHAPVILS